jgi:hypothetical protein
MSSDLCRVNEDEPQFGYLILDAGVHQHTPYVSLTSVYAFTPHSRHVSYNSDSLFGTLTIVPTKSISSVRNIRFCLDMASFLFFAAYHVRPNELSSSATTNWTTRQVMPNGSSPESRVVTSWPAMILKSQSKSIWRLTSLRDWTLDTETRLKTRQ